MGKSTGQVPPGAPEDPFMGGYLKLIPFLYGKRQPEGCSANRGEFRGLAEPLRPLHGSATSASSVVKKTISYECR